MGEIISFSKARKARAKADKEKAAAENRIKFGRTKAEKQIDKAETARLEKGLDDHRLKDD